MAREGTEDLRSKIAKLRIKDSLDKWGANIEEKQEYKVYNW